MNTVKEQLSVTLFQLDLVWENREENLKRIEKQIQGLNTPGDVFMLPEMFTTGFTMKSEQFAEKDGEYSLNWMRKIAKEYDVLVIGSLIVNEQEQYFNRLFAVQPNGDFDTYDKRHLFRMGMEHEHYTQGSKRTIIHYKGWRIFPLICYDLRFPVWSRNRNDYDVLIYIANWPASRQMVYNTLLKARALENQVYVAGVNRVGDDGMGLSYVGGTQVINPRGNVIAECEANKEQVITQDISLDELNAFREKFPVGLDADDFSIEL